MEKHGIRLFLNEHVFLFPRKGLHHKFEKNFNTLNNLDNLRLPLYQHSSAEPLRKHIAHVTLAGLWLGVAVMLANCLLGVAMTFVNRKLRLWTLCVDRIVVRRVTIIVSFLTSKLVTLRNAVVAALLWRSASNLHNLFLWSKWKLN